ncbi:hypothetical protein GCM10027586_08440 [Kineococcus gypseus]
MNRLTLEGLRRLLADVDPQAVLMSDDSRSTAVKLVCGIVHLASAEVCGGEIEVSTDHGVLRFRGVPAVRAVAAGLAGPADPPAGVATNEIREKG